MKNKLKDLTNLKYLSDAIVSFELKKYEVISKFAETSDWNQVYVNDSRYELIRLIMLSNFVTKGFFTMSDLVGATNLNTRSIERLISRATKQGYFEKIPSKDKRVIEEYKKIKNYKKMIKFVYQNRPLGTGDAVYKTKNIIKDNFFLMLLPDDLIIKKNCSKAMISIYRKKKCSVMASMRVQRKTVNRWGIYMKDKNINKKNFYIKDVIEKPNTKDAPSNNAVIGRYILPKKIFSILKNQKKGKGGEIHITDAIRTLIKQKNKFIGHNFEGKYLDCGTMHGYIKSSLEIAKS